MIFSPFSRKLRTALMTTALLAFMPVIIPVSAQAQDDRATSTKTAGSSAIGDQSQTTRS
jgi:hypothetical protein